MPLVVENGTVVTGANSYTTLANARLILQSVGQDLAESNQIAEQQLLGAMSYIESFRSQFKGIKTIETQPLQWPRYDVYIDQYYFDSSNIPQELINAQVYAAYEISKGEDLQGSSDGLSIQSEEVSGAVKVSYFNTGSVDGSPNYVRVNDELNVLLSRRLGMRGQRG